MRRTSREINIFSMSALDLFASAMGAFILIAIILFPYYPNTGMSAVEVSELRARIAELKGAVDKAQARASAAEAQAERRAKEKKALEERLAKAEFPDVDLVIVLDITGSMRQEIGGLKREITQLIKVLDRLAPSVAVGVVAFGDRGWDRPISAQPLKLVTGSSSRLRALVRFVEGLEPRKGKGGGRNEKGGEAFLAGLERAVGMPWRGKAGKKVIVAITDDQAYKSEWSASAAAARRFAGDGGMVSVVGTHDPSKDPDVNDFVARVANAGRGRVIEGGGSIASTVLLALL